MRRRGRVEAARWAEWACILEVCASKPGNVNRRHDFADATLTDFLISAVALGEALRGTRRWTLGELILRGVRETRRRVGTNTNLGMILLLVPLAMGAVRSPRGELREGVRRVLAETDGEDSRLAYEAIRLAAPGGLGRAERHDLAGEAPPALSEAMAEAASRDSVAREYVSDFDLTFGLVLPSLIRGLDGGLSLSEATVRAFLETLAEVPDTLIARKVGAETAAEVSRFARVLSGGSASTLSGTGVERSSFPSGACPAFGGGGKQEPIFPGPRIDSEGLEIFDAKLRSRGNRLNPGTTADLVAAGLFALLAEEGEERILAAR